MAAVWEVAPQQEPWTPGAPLLDTQPLSPLPEGIQALSVGTLTP